MTNSEMEIEPQNDGSASKTNLIVNYLPQDITLGAFVKIFQAIGEIDTFRLVKDKDTGISLGYGFINYCRKEDAENAVKTLNGTQVSNKIIKVAFAKPDAPKSVNLFVSGLPATMHLHELEDLFSKYGRVITTRLLLDDNKTVDGAEYKVNALGFVRFEERADAERAITELNGTILLDGGEPITVMFPTDNAKKLNASFAEFIKGNVNSTTVHKIKTKLGAGGKDSILINKGINRYTPIGNLGYNNGPAQHEYPLAPPPPLPQIVNAGFSIPQPQQMLGNSAAGALNQMHVVYIFGLEEDANDSTLWGLFGPFGPVHSAKVVRDPNSDKCKGFGFVTMYNYGDALEAIRALDGLQHRNRRLQVSFKTKKST